MFSRAAPSNKASNRPSNKAVNYLQCGQSELRCTVNIKCILDFKDLVWKRVITFYVDYAGEIVIFWSNWVKENILLKSVSCKLLCIEWTRSYWVAQDTIFNNLYKPRWKYEKEYIYITELLWCTAKINNIENQLYLNKINLEKVNINCFILLFFSNIVTTI